jgi:hypothetical protein
MSKLTKISLAAGAAFLSTAAGAVFLPTGAFAMQQNIVDPPIPYEDVPQASINAGSAPAGVSWQPGRPGAKAPPVPALDRGPIVERTQSTEVIQPEEQVAVVEPEDPTPQASVQLAGMNRGGPMHRAPPPHAIMHRSGPPMMHHQGGNWHGGTWHGGSGGSWGGGWSHGGSHIGGHQWQRVGRGWRMQPYWWSPRFRLHDWRVYGFPAPRDDWFWIRYYDDALLVDRFGMVHDGRWGVDWDRYGERWDQDQFGVPSYQGYEDEGRGPEDVAAYGYGAPMIITETITTTTSYDGGHAVRHHAPQCDGPDCCDCGPPPPPPAPPPAVGERG